MVVVELVVVARGEVLQRLAVIPLMVVRLVLGQREARLKTVQQVAPQVALTALVVRVAVAVVMLLLAGKGVPVSNGTVLTAQVEEAVAEELGDHHMTVEREERAEAMAVAVAVAVKTATVLLIIMMVVLAGKE